MLDICNYFNFESAVHLGEKYDIRNVMNHEIKVASFAAAVFDETRKMHNLCEAHRNLLCCSALIHDIGWFINKVKHHKHTRYIILNDSILDSVPKQLRGCLAVVASSHRGSIDKNIIEYPRNVQQELKYLIAILRISDSLDHSHKLNNSLKRILFHERQLIFYLDSSQFQKTLVRFNTKSKLFNEMFDIETRLEPEMI